MNLWTLFSREENIIECCKGDTDGLRYRFILIDDGRDRAIYRFGARFGKTCKHGSDIVGTYLITEGSDRQEVWEKSEVAIEYSCHWKDAIGCSDVIMMTQEERVVMPNGVDGLNCRVCGEFWPYVEINTPEGYYICVDCRFWRDGKISGS